MFELLFLFMLAILMPLIGMIIMTLGWGIVFAVGKLLGLEE